MGETIAEDASRDLSKVANNTLLSTAQSAAQILLHSKQSVEIGLLAFSKEIEQALTKELSLIKPFFTSRDFDIPGDGPRDFKSHPGYIKNPDIKISEQKISLDHPVFFLAPGIEIKEAKKDIQTLQQLNHILVEIKKEFGSILHWTYISLESGVHLCYPGHGGYPEDYDPRKRTWYKNATDKVSWILPIVDATSGLVMFTATKRIYYPDGKFAGVVAFDIPITEIIAQKDLSSIWTKEMRSFMTAYEEKSITGEPGLLILAQMDYQGKPSNKKGIIEFEWLQSSDSKGFQKLTQECKYKSSGYIEMPYNGVDSIWSYAYISDGTQFIIIVPKAVIQVLPEKHKKTIVAYTKDQQITTIIIGGLFILLLTFAAFFISRIASKEIETIQSAAIRLSKGDLEAHIDMRTGDERDLVIEAFNKMGPQLENHFKNLKALELAHEIQQNLLPVGTKQIPGLDISGSSMYCDETGGDYYDYIDIGAPEANRLAVIVGDVSGHGIGSALLMATARALLRQRIAMSGDADNIITDVNHHLSLDTDFTAQFMTLFYCEFDLRNRQVSWVRAGHDPAITYDIGPDEFHELRKSGVALGLDKTYEYKKFSHPFTPGQIIFIGTDGIWEMINPDGKMFGKEALKQIIRKKASKSAETIRDAIFQELKEFRKESALLDDVTMVIIKVDK